MSAESLAEVVRQVERVRLSVGDPEGAHSEEDRARHLVLTLIADGELEGDEAVAACEHVLTTELLEFPRWCA